MESLIVTALFDIKRDKNGDGRTIDEYLNWFSKTLELKCDMVIYTEERFKDFILDKRNNIQNKTNVIIQKLEEVPFWKNNQKIKEITKTDTYKSKISDPNRIECYLSEYNVIQYSKFGWIKNAFDIYNNYDFYFWMDAGYSRFFGNYDISRKWPNEEIINNKLITILGNQNYLSNFNRLDPHIYMWDKHVMVSGGLFSIPKELVNKINYMVEETFNEMIEHGCVNNEQFALAIIAKRTGMFNVMPIISNGHNGLFLKFSNQNV